MEGEPERSESSREQAAPIRANHSGGIKGHGFLGGSKPLERRGEVVMVSPENAGAERRVRKDFSTTREDQSSEERSPGALGFERESQGSGSQAISPRG
jgi:hypothetical protein